jgi:hypothetical protein
MIKCLMASKWEPLIIRVSYKSLKLVKILIGNLKNI